MSQLQETLARWAAHPSLAGRYDNSDRDARLLYANGVDGLLAALTAALVADGMDPTTVTRVYADHASEALDKAAPFVRAVEA